MSKWLTKFLEKDPQNGTDRTDRFSSETNVSVLSVPLGGPSDKNLGNMPETRTDRTDRFNSDVNVSVLSVSPYGLSENVPFYPFDRNTVLHNFEERIAIAEYDGQQTSAQAQRIAYQDAFISVLNTLPYEENYENNWLDQRIKATKEWLTAQRLEQPK